MRECDDYRVNSVQKTPTESCPQLPGTILRVNIPAGAVINVANLFEISSPAGICLIIRIPLLGGEINLNSIVQSIQQAGGTVEITK